MKITAALVGNFGDRLDPRIIAALGNQSMGLSISQIQSMRPQDLLAVLNILASVTGWDEGQARAIIQVLLSSGVIKVGVAWYLILQ